MPPYVPRPSIGGSDVGAILGISKFKTGVQVWDRIKGLAPAETERQPWQERGVVLEPIIADRYEQATTRVLGVPTDTYWHPGYAMLHANPDRIIFHDGPNGILEIKCLGTWTFRETQERGVSPEYYAQLQHYLFVTGLEWGSFAIFNADQWKLLSVDVGRDDAWLAEAVPKLLDWWQTYVEAGVRPPLTLTDQPLWPAARVGAEAVDWTGRADFNQAVADLKAAREQAKLAEHLRTLAENRVKTLMGEEQVCLSAHGKVSWKEQARRTFNAKRFLEAHPEIDPEPYYETTVSRTFRPTFTGEESRE